MICSSSINCCRNESLPKVVILCIGMCAYVWYHTVRTKNGLITCVLYLDGAQKWLLICIWSTQAPVQYLTRNSRCLQNDDSITFYVPSFPSNSTVKKFKLLGITPQMLLLYSKVLTFFFFFGDLVSILNFSNYMFLKYEYIGLLFLPL